MKLFNIANPAFNEAFGKLMGAKLSGKVAFKATKIAAKIQENGELYNKTRIATCEKFSDKDAEGKALMNENNTFKIPEEAMPAFNQEIADLMNIDFECPTFSIDELEPAELTANDLMALNELITE